MYIFGRFQAADATQQHRNIYLKSKPYTLEIWDDGHEESCNSRGIKRLIIAVWRVPHRQIKHGVLCV